VVAAHAGRAQRIAYGASYDRRLFEEHGYFREDLRVGEDAEFNRPDCRPGRNGTRESSRCIAIQRDCFRSLPINIGAANGCLL
jgi:hypothetical protein